MIARLTPTKPLRFGEFVALMALMMASVAFSLDAMLPALPQIGQELSPDAPARGQLVITFFVLGLGLGTLICGPVSDAYGRKSVLLAGIALYLVGAVMAVMAQSIEMLLAARFVQGVGGAAPRVVATAMIRDLYEGRTMARVTSIIMTLFVLVPALAPSIGAGIMWLSHWRMIFLAFVVFGLVAGLWLTLRQPETLPPERRRPLRLSKIAAALVEILTNPRVMVYVLALTFAFAPLYVWLSNLPMIFDDVYGRAGSFPFWFALTAVVAGAASIVNAKLVIRFGMQRIASLAFLWQLSVSLVFFGLLNLGLSETWNFGLFVAFMCAGFMSIGLTFGNLNALAMQPLGHIAGIGASVVMAFSTVCAALISLPISLAYDGTPLPLIAGMVLCAGAALALMMVARHIMVQEA